MEGTRDKIEIRPYRITELAALYGVHKRTLLKWIKPIEAEIGERNGWYFSIRQVKVIFNHLDLPDAPHPK